MTQPQPQSRPKRPPFWKGFTLPPIRFPRWFAKKPPSAKRRTRGFEAAADEKLAFWSEKVPLTMAMIAQALVITRWYIGREAPASVAEVLVWANVIIAIVAGVAIDLVMVTTVMARRKGRRGIWGILTAASAAVASALIALDVYGGWSPGPYLHIAYPVVVFLFAMHLSSPRLRALNLPLLVQRRQLIRRLLQGLRSSLQEGADLRSRFAEVSQQFADLRSRFAEVSQQLADLRSQHTYHSQDLAHQQQRVADREHENANLRSQNADLSHQLAARSQEAEQLRRDLAERNRLVADLSQATPDPLQVDLFALAEALKNHGATWSEIETLIGIPNSTIRARLKARSNGQLNEVGS
jgi:hypothetical protein